jgi:hypothetical protein
MLCPGLARYRIPVFDLCGVCGGFHCFRHVNVLARELTLAN